MLKLKWGFLLKKFGKFGFHVTALSVMTSHAGRVTWNVYSKVKNVFCLFEKFGPKSVCVC